MRKEIDITLLNDKDKLDVDTEYVDTGGILIRRYFPQADRSGWIRLCADSPYGETHIATIQITHKGANLRFVGVVNHFPRMKSRHLLDVLKFADETWLSFVNVTLTRLKTDGN